LLVTGGATIIKGEDVPAAKFIQGIPTNILFNVAPSMEQSVGSGLFVMSGYVEIGEI